VSGSFGSPRVSGPRTDLGAIKILPGTPTRFLLPIAPTARKIPGPLLTNDLARVPEVEFQAAQPKTFTVEKGKKHTARLIAGINHLNGRKEDGFLKELMKDRSDLVGLPFAMGSDCRTLGERKVHFARMAGQIRTILRNPNFWENYAALCKAEDSRSAGRPDPALREQITVARIGALMQILAPESVELRLGLVEHLSTLAHVEATRALARLAIFSPESSVRDAALDALKTRRERDYTKILEEGLRYPLPAVAKRAAEATVKLERNDLIPQLVALLDEPDPRAPRVEEVERKKVPVVRELVRVNHHRNCLLCHSPVDSSGVTAGTLTSEVPTPNEPLPAPNEGYRNSQPELLVRLDVTYLRQDFSALQPVADAQPWPEMQRFDFLVRKRVLSAEEARGWEEQLNKRAEGELSPYHRASLVALRELTGKDTEPNAAAWRRLLKLPRPE
jgi:hypothetical protein